MQFHDFVLQQPEAPFRVSRRRYRAGEGDEFGLLLAVENTRFGGFRRFAGQCRFQAFFYQLFSGATDRRHVGVERRSDLAVAPTLSGFGDVGFEQDTGAGQLLGRALSGADELAQVCAFFGAEPDDVFFDARCGQLRESTPYPRGRCGNAS